VVLETPCGKTTTCPTHSNYSSNTKRCREVKMNYRWRELEIDIVSYTLEGITCPRDDVELQSLVVNLNQRRFAIRSES
jgi:hypothetical protein